MIDLTVIQYGISQLEAVIYVKWGFLLAISLLLIWTLRRQNKTIASVAHDQGNRQTDIYMKDMALMRGRIVLLLWLLLFGFIVAMDINKEIDKIFVSEPRYTSVTPAPPTVASSSQQTLSSTAQTNLSPDEQTRLLNDLKASYEDAFVSYLVLEKCNQASNLEYQTLYQSLGRKLAKNNASASTAHNTLVAASGTFQGLYQDTPCESSYLSPIRESLDSFLMTIE